MKLLYHSRFLDHDTGLHPENKKRLLAFGDLPETKIQSGETYVELVHLKAYVERVKKACKKSRPLDSDTMTSPGSYNAAVYAIGATIQAAEFGDFALVRPPGHHAHPGRSSGFCLFNNMVISVEYLRKLGKKVLVIDIDGHLGDGTEEYFLDTPEVMYWSLHQYPAFPGGGPLEEIGKGKGKGYTINVPLLAGSGDDVYMKAFDTVLQYAVGFAPDVVAVSAGFDAHRHDPLLQLQLSTDVYHEIGKRLRERFTHIYATFEGGYNIEVLPFCVYNFLDGINGKKKRFTEEATTSSHVHLEDIEKKLHSLKTLLQPCWKI